MAKITVFASYAHGESELASLLKTSLTEHFIGLVDVFVSSDFKSIGAGDDWYTAIMNAVEAADIHVVLCSQDSITSSWVNIELGAALCRQDRKISLFATLTCNGRTSGCVHWRINRGWMRQSGRTGVSLLHGRERPWFFGAESQFRRTCDDDPRDRNPLSVPTNRQRHSLVTAPRLRTCEYSLPARECFASRVCNSRKRYEKTST